MYDSISSCTISSLDANSSHFRVPVTIAGMNRSLVIPAMIDSGATATFISSKFACDNNMMQRPLNKIIGLRNIDGSNNKAGSITHFVRLQLTLGDHTENVEFLVTDIGPEDMILGLPWLTRINPIINWTKGEMTLPVSSEEADDLFSRIKANRLERRQWIKAGIIHHSDDEVWSCAGFTYSTKLAVDALKDKPKKSFNELVPSEYHVHAKVFSEEESHRLPKHQPWDHAIDLSPDAPQTIRSKVYPLSPAEHETLRQWIKEESEKGTIGPSKSPYSVPVFFVKKKNGELRLIQDYRPLNKFTVKNRYPLPLASDIINKLKDANIFTKFDVRWGYTNVRIKKGDEWKGAFITPYGLYEPKVMFFGMTNSPATFQSLMNHIFADLIAEGKVAVYLDDILIWSDTLSTHRKIVHEVLKRLHDHDLYLRPEKCEFERDRIEYLGLIIRPGQVEMDPVKIDAIMSWPTPKNLKDV